MPALGLPIVRISHRRGSLIPLPLSERREADHTIQTTEWAARAESKLVLIYAESWTRKAKPTLWTERYTHHTSHFTVSTNLISFTPHPLSRGLLTSTVPASLQPDKDRQRARVYIPVSYGIYTLWYFCGVKQLLFCSCPFLICHYSDFSTQFSLIYRILKCFYSLWSATNSLDGF